MKITSTKSKSATKNGFIDAANANIRFPLTSKNHGNTQKANNRRTIPTYATRRRAGNKLNGRRDGRTEYGQRRRDAQTIGGRRRRRRDGHDRTDGQRTDNVDGTDDGRTDRGQSTTMATGRRRNGHGGTDTTGRADDMIFTRIYIYIYRMSFVLFIGDVLVTGRCLYDVSVMIGNVWMMFV